MKHQTEMKSKGGEKSALESEPQESSDQVSDKKIPKCFKDDSKEIDKTGGGKKKPKIEDQYHFHCSKLNMSMKKNTHRLQIIFSMSWMLILLAAIL